MKNPWIIISAILGAGLILVIGILLGQNTFSEKRNLSLEKGTFESAVTPIDLNGPYSTKVDFPPTEEQCKSMVNDFLTGRVYSIRTDAEGQHCKLRYVPTAEECQKFLTNSFVWTDTISSAMDNRARGLRDSFDNECN